MPTSPLDILPVEILALVCDYVELSHRPSLLSFALASKRCHSVAKRLFFHTIRFSPNNPSELELDVDECIRILERNASVSHVRTLLVTGPLWGHYYSTRALISANDGDNRTWSFGLPVSLSDISALIPTHSDRPPENDTLTDAAWQPLVRLVQLLPGLGDVLYANRHRVPPCLLQALLQYRPRCRLHVFSFRLHSLRFPETDPDELAPVTAPCLYSIWMWYCGVDGFDDGHSEPEPNYHAEAIDSMVRGLAPNLKEVHLFLQPGGAYEMDNNPLPPRPPWKGFTNVGADSTCMPAHLKSLELGLDFHSPISLEKEVADRWAANNLSSLRALRLRRFVKPEALGSHLQAKNFPYLTTLLFTCAEDQEQAYYDDVKHLIHGLPQLTSLEIISWPPNLSLAAALPRRLRELWLWTRDTLEHSLNETAILELAACCPHVETLALKIRRSRGSATEVALYKALGRFAKLRRLVLTLDVSPVPWFPIAPSHEQGDQFGTRALAFDTAIDPSFDESDRQHLTTGLYPYRNGHIRDAFINTAVDETLARAIFRTICAVKASVYGPSAALALDRMLIEPVGALSFPHRNPAKPSLDLRPYEVALGRRWLLERDIRDDARGVIRARDVDKKFRLQWVSYVFEEYRGYCREMTYMAIFRRLWPERPGVSTNWYDDWHSWPLDETA
ncbi:hypothetical protein F5144DRAFT_498249 [Chaetomium tenue]|uniref:Uncharacterized protein n=1 Tax=Chaetomium tenue TaxID=1854479 RepID=A0ACB7NV54_9PEZI|nr:hypothetical protein F5144DRAFT_498249 [Chaetomium globosum]